MAIFTLSSLGLSAGSVGDGYDIKRGNCFHSGVDYKTNKIPMAFQSAVYGKVVGPLGGDWGTIGIQPFGTNDLVQYLHCSSIYVAEGEIVAPWTKLGKTGEVCPPGTCSGIHLHLHIVAGRGKPKYPCWSRNYVNPSTWNYVHPLIGTWTRSSDGGWTGGSVARSQCTENLIIGSDLIPASNSYFKQCQIEFVTSKGRCVVLVTAKHHIRVVGYTKNAIRFAAEPAGGYVRQVQGPAQCNLRLTQSASEGEILLKGSRLQLSGKFAGSDKLYARSSLQALPELWMSPHGEDSEYMPPSAEDSESTDSEVLNLEDNGAYFVERTQSDFAALV